MAEEIAALVKALSSDDLSIKLRSAESASLLKLGLNKLFSILKQSVKPIDYEDSTGDGKLGLQVLDQAQIHALASVSLAVVNAARLLPSILLVFWVERDRFKPVFRSGIDCI